MVIVGICSVTPVKQEVLATLGLDWVLLASTNLSDFVLACI